MSLPGMDLKARTIFGKPTSIFGAYITDVNSKLFEYLKMSYSTREPLRVALASPSVNTLDEALSNPASVFNVMQYLFTVIAVLCTFQSIATARKFYLLNKGNFPLFSFCTFSLVFIVGSNILRIIKSVDVLGV